jgi:hypothetical protein
MVGQSFPNENVPEQWSTRISVAGFLTDRLQVWLSRRPLSAFFPPDEQQGTKTKITTNQIQPER